MNFIPPMKNAFTPNDLVRFIYHEVTAAEETLIKQHIAENREVSEEFLLLMDAVKQLEVNLEPSESSMNIILAYSREHETSHC